MNIRLAIALGLIAGTLTLGVASRSTIQVNFHVADAPMPLCPPRGMDCSLQSPKDAKTLQR